MKCENCKDLLWAYLEQELNGEENAEIEQHLAQCADCRKELDMQREIVETLGSLPDEELPEGYHAELMRKLQAEAAPNVVPFPEKKKTRKWKQLSMIAAAALVVVAAGGINGVMEMRQSQNEAVHQMELAADGEEPLETEEATEKGMAMDKAEEQPSEIQEIQTKAVRENSEQKERNDTAVQKNDSMVTEGTEFKKTTEDTGNALASGGMDTDMPETAAVTGEEQAAPYSIMRSAAPMAATDTATLQVADPDTAMEAIRECLIAAEGYEEMASAENSIYAVIPVENFETFGKTLEGLGKLQWTKKGTLAEGEEYRSVEIRVVTD